MKKTIITITNLICAIIFLDSVNALHALLYFIIAGQIPGTNIYLDSQTMMILTMIPAGFLIGRLSTKAYTALLNVAFVKQRA